MCDETSFNCQTNCVSRRLFVGAAGASAVTMVLGDLFPNRVSGRPDHTPVEVSMLPRKKVAQMSALEPDQPVSFHYPNDADLHNCLLVKTGERSGGGIGPDQDIVAFSGRCTHMGVSLEGEYNSEHKTAGPCRMHLTTFDLTRHGIVIAGHATESLPQILLELDGDEIYATGIAGLLYGNSRNLPTPSD